jgi:hypothetical protein
MNATSSLNLLITPNYAAPYDQRMVDGLAAGFVVHGHKAIATPAPLTAREVADKCRELDIDVVIQVNRTRDPEVELPDRVRHISWYQDVFPETMHGFAESFRADDILYALGDPDVLGLNADMPCYVGSLVSGVAPEIFDYRCDSRPDHSVDFSLCGFIPAPMPTKKSLKHYLRPANLVYGSTNDFVQAAENVYLPLQGALDIHALAEQIDARTSGWNNLSGARRNLIEEMFKLLKQFSPGFTALSPRQRLISYFTREYPRLLDRRALIDAVLKVSESMELYGPGWETHSDYRQYAKGIITTQEGLLDVYMRSRINLANNTHGLGLHSRTLECMAVNGFIFTHDSPHDTKPGGMLTAFDPEVHFGQFTLDNVVEESERWIRDEKARIEAGSAARTVVREQHCWQHRAQQIVDDLGK